MTRIAFNALGLKSKTGGVESHIYNVIKYILAKDTETKYYLYIGENTKNVFKDLKSYKNLKIIVFPINTNNSTIRVITEHTLLAISLLLNRIDLVHHFCNYMPRICPTKSITTLHDLSGFFYNENFEIIGQFDDYKSLSIYLGVSIDCLQSYLSKSRKNFSKKIKDKVTDKFVYIRRDYCS